MSAWTIAGRVLGSVLMIRGLAVQEGTALTVWIVFACVWCGMFIAQQYVDARLIESQREGLRLSDELVDAYRRSQGRAA